MAQQHKISRNNTTTGKDANGRITSVTLHSTTILEINRAKKTVTVRTNGYNTATTATRMRQAFHEIGLPLSAWRKGGVFHVSCNGKEVDLVDGREYGYTFKNVEIPA